MQHRIKVLECMHQHKIFLKVSEVFTIHNLKKHLISYSSSWPYGVPFNMYDCTLNVSRQLFTRPCSRETNYAPESALICDTYSAQIWKLSLVIDRGRSICHPTYTTASIYLIWTYADISHKNLHRYLALASTH